MATVVLQAAGTGIGTFLGGPIGGLIGRAIGAVAGSFIDQRLFGEKKVVEGARLSDLRVIASSEGAPIPKLWGRMRVAGQVIWATDFIEKTKTQTQGGKGSGASGTKVKTYSYFANFAVALCEGEIDRIGRVWADGKLFDLSSVTARVYTGSETQAADSLIIAKEGAGNAPAYRGIAYIVFEQLPLADFGNRLPQLSFEVFRSGGGAETNLRAVSIIPGSTEFGYDTAVVTREAEEGVTETENAHASAERSDFEVSIDQLTSTCRNMAASLVVAWFGTDLRCGRCELRPGVDAAVKATSPEAWQVNGIGRDQAWVVSQNGGGPAYGGTPSDPSVLRAIADLKARGLKVMFHPFVLMDIPAGNGKPDPWGGAEQGSYPWRGRVTASTAPGRPGSPDKTDAVAPEIARFVGEAQPRHFTARDMTVSYAGPAEWSFRRMILHYARLCAGGGVDAFLIGSETTGLTRLRRSGNVFPFVAALRTLAGEVKTILPDAMISYGADWSEYAGYRPADGSGDVFFNLDPLWSSLAVDFIGIDNYLPLADWRDGDQHADYRAGWRSIYDLAYLKSNIAGGEGFDWYYRSAAERAAQIRTPITDGARGNPWVFRAKDLKGWWSNRHFDRPGGVEQASATGWVPQSKPVWFTEAGCPAVDKGANEPNAFIDAKSVESHLPYFSHGQRDDLMQARYLTAMDEYWSGAGSHNPQAPVPGGRMVNPARIFFWAWDARPYPQFPARDDVWSDAANYERGHWLNGRAGAQPLGSLIAAVAASFGLDDVDVSGVEGLVSGFVIDRVMSGRDALEGLMTAFGLDAVESEGRLRIFMRKAAPMVPLAVDDLAEAQVEAPLYRITRLQETELPASIKLSYAEAGLDYRLAVVEAKREGGFSKRDGLIELPAAVSQEQAQKRAQVVLQEAWSGRETVELALPLSQLALEPGDAVALALDGGTFTFRIEEVTDGSFRKIRGRSFEASVQEPADAPARGEAAETAVVYGKPLALVMDLPRAEDGVTAYAPWIAAAAEPWPGTLALSRRTGASSFEANSDIDDPATLGRLTSPLPAGPLGCLDRGNSFTVRLSAGAVFSTGLDELLQGANAAAVGSAETGWEIIQFATAELIDAQSWRISLLLRGQSGSDPRMRAVRPAGERFVLLDQAVIQPELSLAQAGLEQSWRIGPAQYDLARAQTDVTLRSRMLGLRPLSPVQPKITAQGPDLALSWIRTRSGGDSWDVGEVPLAEERELYRLEIASGAQVKRVLTVAEASYLYRAADIAADFGPGPRRITLRIAQISTLFGPGAVTERTFNA